MKLLIPLCLCVALSASESTVTSGNSGITVVGGDPKSTTIITANTSASQQILIPSLSYAHGVILSGSDLVYGETREVTLKLKEVTFPEGAKVASIKFIAHVLCDAKAIEKTDRVHLVAKKIVYVFPSGYTAELPMSGFAVSTLDGRDSIPAEIHMNLDKAIPQVSLAKPEHAEATLQALVKEAKSTIVLNNNQAIDLIFTDRLVLEDKIKAN